MTNHSPDSERRQYLRIPFIAEVVMEHSGQQWTCQLLDISLKGMLVEPPQNVSPILEDTYSIELVLGEDAAIRMEAKIVHTEKVHWGLQWENIDIEGLTHLRRLLELNLSDLDEMHRELAELG